MQFTPYLKIPKEISNMIESILKKDDNFDDGDWWDDGDD